MALVARLGDSVAHPDKPAWKGSIVSASSNVYANGALVARNGDRAICSKHGPQTIIASSSVTANGSPVAHLGDSITCGAVITSSASNVTAA